MRILEILTVSALAAVLALGCAPQETEVEPAEEAAEAPAAEEAPAMDEEPMAMMAEAEVDVRTAEPYGEYLVDGEGISLYLFVPDEGAAGSTCYDDCAEAWPPFTTDGDPQAAAPAVDAALLGTITRDDGETQVTYGGWPLYYFQQDLAPGDTEGQDVHGFGGEWYLVSPAGEQIEATAGS